MSDVVARFYICGGLVETYECVSSPPSREDLQNIQKIKQDLLRNFGYAPVVHLSHNA